MADPVVVPVGLPAPEKNPKAQKGFARGFMDFIQQYHVIPLAIAVVLGNAVNDVVKVLVDGVITPFIALMVPSETLQTYELTINHSTFKLGAVLSAVISFMVVAAVIYIFVKKILKDDKILQKKD